MAKRWYVLFLIIFYGVGSTVFANDLLKLSKKNERVIVENKTNQLLIFYFPGDHGEGQRRFFTLLPDCRRRARPGTVHIGCKKLSEAQFFSKSVEDLWIDAELFFTGELKGEMGNFILKETKELPITKIVSIQNRPRSKSV